MNTHNSSHAISSHARHSSSHLVQQTPSGPSRSLRIGTGGSGNNGVMFLNKDRSRFAQAGANTMNPVVGLHPHPQHHRVREGMSIDPTSPSSGKDVNMGSNTSSALSSSANSPHTPPSASVSTFVSNTSSSSISGHSNSNSSFNSNGYFEYPTARPGTSSGVPVSKNFTVDASPVQAVRRLSRDTRNSVGQQAVMQQQHQLHQQAAPALHFSSRATPTPSSSSLPSLGHARVNSNSGLGLGSYKHSSSSLNNGLAGELLLSHSFNSGSLSGTHSGTASGTGSPMSDSPTLQIRHLKIGGR